MGVKGRFPFRVGAASYVIPADMLTNVKYLADRVDDVELLVFESDAVAGLPDAAMLCELARIAGDRSLTYSVHLPLDIRLGDGDAAERERSVGKCLRAIERMRIARPRAWILHCDRRPRQGGDPVTERVWAENTGQSLRAILAEGVAAAAVSVETLDASFPLLEPVIRELGLSVCLDVGHLLLHSLDVGNYFGRFGYRAAVVHLHGVVDGKDHRSLRAIPEDFLGGILSLVASRGKQERVVTIEVFNESDFEESMRIIEGMAP
jgi:sugar phosphate isomerase/epimerase